MRRHDVMFSHYERWEDWHNGMYGSLLREETIGRCMEILSNPPLFAAVLAELSQEWPHAIAQHLSNRDKNHRPWCGRLACNYEHRATISEVNAAWADLTLQDRLAADEVADTFTNDWRRQVMRGQTRLTL